MKKSIIALLIVLSVVAVSVSAAAPAELTVNAAEAEAGRNVTLNVGITGNPGFCYLRARPVYDTNALELIEAKAGDDLKADTIGLGLNVSIENGSDLKGDGSVLILTFKVKDSAPSGTYEVRLDVKECCNYDELDVSVSSVAGSITVKGTNGGDQPAVTEKPSDPQSGSGYIIAAVAAGAAAVCAAAVTVIVIAKRKKKQ